MTVFVQNSFDERGLFSTNITSVNDWFLNRTQLGFRYRPRVNCGMVSCYFVWLSLPRNVRRCFLFSSMCIFLEPSISRYVLVSRNNHPIGPVRHSNRPVGSIIQLISLSTRHPPSTRFLRQDNLPPISSAARIAAAVVSIVAAGYSR